MSVDAVLAAARQLKYRQTLADKAQASVQEAIAERDEADASRALAAHAYRAAIDALVEEQEL